MKASEMRGKSESELQELLHELLKEQFNLRMQQGTGQLSRPARVKEVRKDIARVKTVVTEMKAGEAQ
jgi:large subunit ribosomal protein L29